jgi:hypothetical protein
LCANVSANNDDFCRAANSLLALLEKVPDEASALRMVKLSPLEPVSNVWPDGTVNDGPISSEPARSVSARSKDKDTWRAFGKKLAKAAETFLALLQRSEIGLSGNPLDELVDHWNEFFFMQDEQAVTLAMRAKSFVRQQVRAATTRRAGIHQLKRRGPKPKYDATKEEKMYSDFQQSGIRTEKDFANERNENYRDIHAMFRRCRARKSLKSRDK